MRIGIARYRPDLEDHAPAQIYYNVPEDGSYLEFMQQLGVKSYDSIWVEKNKQVCVPCRMRRILTYQFGLQGVEIHEFDD